MIEIYWLNSHRIYACVRLLYSAQIWRVHNLIWLNLERQCYAESNRIEYNTQFAGWIPCAYMWELHASVSLPRAPFEAAFHCISKRCERAFRFQRPTDNGQGNGIIGKIHLNCSRLSSLRSTSDKNSVGFEMNPISDERAISNAFDVSCDLTTPKISKLRFGSPRPILSYTIQFKI